MFQQITKKVASTALFAILLANATQAQNVYWGAGSADPASDSIGRFASIDSTLGSLGWSPNTNATAPYATWTYSFNGRSNAPISSSWANAGATGAITSPSIADGAAIFDCDSISVANSLAASAVFGAVLQSPAIDLSAAAGKFVAVKFYVNYFDFQTTTFDLEFIPVDTVGAAVTSVNIRNITGQNGVRAAYNGWVIAKIPVALTSNAADLTAAKVRINYNGNYYFFAVDDISVIDAPAYDLSIGVPTVGNTLGNSFSTLRVSNNFSQPLSQVSAEDYGFGAKVTNRGAANMVAADNGRLTVSIDRETAPGTWTNQVMDSVALGNLATDIDSNYTANFTNNWLPTDTGYYRVTYRLAIDSLDGNNDNNEAVQFFNITENYYSKLPTRADGYPDYTGRSFPGASGTNVVSEFEYGSMYYFPAGNGNIRLDSVLLRLYATTVDTANFMNTVNVRVYKYRDIDGDGRLADDPTANEAVLVALGSVAVSDITTGYKRTAATVIDVNTGDEFFFSDTTTYMVSMDQRAATGLENPTGTRFRGFWFGTYRINYGLNAAFFNAIPSPIRAAEITNAGAAASNEWNWIGFGAYQVPSIGLALSRVVISVDEATADQQQFRLYPNPTGNQLNVEIALDAASNVQYMMTDVSGRVVRMAAKQNIQNQVVTFDVQDLAAGVYFLSVKTNKGTTTQRFIKE
jgi:hypothetical protein